VEMLVRAFITAVRGAAAEAQPAAPREASAAINAKTPPPRAPPVPQPAPPKAKTGEPFWKRLPRWFVIAVPIFLCICLCLIGFLIIRSREKDQTPTETSAIQQPVEPVGGVTPVAPVEPIGNATPDIPPDAREAWLHLNKGLDLMGSGDKSAGIKEFQTALDLIPTERTEVILLAVQRLADSGNWMMAGEFIRKGLQADAHNPALRLAASEVLFRLSADREGVSLLRMMAEQNPDWSTALATYARWLYTFSSNPQDAGSVLQKAKDVAEDDELFLVRTVDGEYLCINGNKGEGLGTLGSVNDNPNTPPWLRVETERMIKKWQ
jgi:tetratricopeptide (TPR) repeat protein